MNRRTPRRRISPRTVRRYRAIKNFLLRALGPSSQPDIQSNSSISLSVLDLKQKINGIEQQLNTVSKHCQDLATLESKLKLKDNLDLEDTDTNTKKIKVKKTEVLHKISQDRCNKTVNNRSTPKLLIRDNEAGIETATSNNMQNQNYSNNYKERRKSNVAHILDPIVENEKRLRRRKTHVVSRTVPADLPMYSSYSFNEPRNCTRQIPGHFEVNRQRNRKKTEYFDPNAELLHNHARQTCEDHINHGRKFHSRPNLDQDFIADIIRRQYRPVKLFGRRESDFSQFSAPVCRDQEFLIRETIEEGSDLCSCCHEKHRRHKESKYMCSHDLSDIRSICDTRLYSSKKHKHLTNHRKHANEYYNDSTMYDVIPVKEKCSPKSRRKFVEDNMIHGNYREVPPSPRTQRPRLNLQAQFQTEDDEDDIYLKKQLKLMKKMQQKSLIQNEGNFSKMSSEVFIHNRNFKGTQNLPSSSNPQPYAEECVGTTSTLQYPMAVLDQAGVNNDITLNTHTTDVSADKTDKTLNEIKDILQSFLQELKKESSQSEKINNSPQSEAPTNINEIQTQIKSNSFNNNNNFGHCSLPPFMPSFPNSCCYPLLPVCPINCMQNGFAVPSPSFTCTACINNSKERTCESNVIKNKTNNSEDASNETQKLIKEIHNLISQNPNSIKKNEFCKNAETKTFATKSACSSSKVSKHDAKVGTRVLKCHSKSCEAIGSREATNTLYATNVSYSDTVLEKGSGEEVTTESVSESEYSSDPTVVDKKKGNKLKNILRSMGILKRNRSDAIEELTESDSSMDVVKPKPKSTLQSHPTSPYQQHIMNYNVHGQEYFHPPFVPHHQYQYECCAHHDPRACYSPTNIEQKMKHSQGRHCHEQDMLTHRKSPIHSPTTMCANFYDPHYGNISPQVPVCLKEIEVKSIGTQSVRKISLLEKLTNKMQVPVQQAKDSSPKQSSTGTKDKNSKDKPEPSLFDWKKIHEKAMQKTTDPLKFSYKTQKRLAEGDNTMRNAMLKKLFYKRNPFSPRNLLVRTLLGKDKSSFGEPPKMYKPKMFL